MSKTGKGAARTARPAPARSSAPKRGAGRGAAAPSRFDRLLAALPISEATLHRIATGAIMLTIAGVAIGMAMFFGVPQAAAVAAAEQIGRAGFRVEGINVTGTRRMNAMAVYALALDQRSRAMPLVDVGAVRQRLLGYGWVADAQVSRRLPDKLVIHIVEREPAAVWQTRGTLTLIDKDGVLLEPVAPGAVVDLPLVIGAGANRQMPAYRALLDAAPALKPMVKAATWIGNRRWNLLFTTGETLALPEEAPARALVKFAELDGARSLLGKGWLRFDLRDPTRLVARKPGIEARPVPAEGAADGASPPDGAATEDAAGPIGTRNDTNGKEA